jgi:hypothetical protein
LTIKDIYGFDRKIKRIERFLIDWDGESRSKFQYNVKVFLKKYWEHCIVFEEFPVPRTKLSVDFLNFTRKIIVEVQGNQHISYTPYFHGEGTEENFLQQLKRDSLKMKFCEANDFKLVEIYPKDKLSKELFLSQGVKL